MATPSSILAWRIPRTEEPGRLRSMGSQRVWHGLATKQQASVQSLSHERLFATPWTAARQAFLSITNSMNMS